MTRRKTFDKLLILIISGKHRQHTFIINDMPVQLSLPPLLVTDAMLLSLCK